MKFIANSLEETNMLAESLAKYLRVNDILTLEGGLGAGKTSFIKALARGMGINPDDVSSPTFTIMQVYESEKSEMKLCHFDVYRLKDGESFYQEGFDEQFNADMVVCIEWPEIIESILPEDRLILRIFVDRENNIDFEAERLVLAEDNSRRIFDFIATGSKSAEVLNNWATSSDYPNQLLAE